MCSSDLGRVLGAAGRESFSPSVVPFGICTRMGKQPHLVDDHLFFDVLAVRHSVAIVWPRSSWLKGREA